MRKQFSVTRSQLEFDMASEKGDSIITCGYQSATVDQKHPQEALSAPRRASPALSAQGECDPWGEVGSAQLR